MDWYTFHLRRKAIFQWVREYAKLPKIPPAFWFLLIQLLGCAAVLYGVAIYSHPIAFIIGGIAAVVVIERQSHVKPELTQEEVLHYQRQIRLALSANKDPFDEPYNVPLTVAWVTYAASLRKKL